MAEITQADALERLNSTFQKIEQLGLARDARVTGVPRDKGGLKVRSRYVLDSYTAYKSPQGDAVGLGILQPPNGDVTVMIHRRQKLNGRLKTVTVDEFPLEQYDTAEQFFIATAIMIHAAHQTWRPVHPSDDMDDGE